MANQYNAWSDERIEQLKRLILEGYSGGVIANELGVTRSSVLGKAFGLQLGNYRNGNPKAPGRSLRKAPGRPRRKRKVIKTIQGPQFETAPIPPQRAEDIARKSFSELSENDCKYPVGTVGEPGFGFCALERMPNSPYCSGHHSVAYTKAPSRKRVTHVTARETSGVMA